MIQLIKKTSILLTNSERKYFFRIIFLMLLGSFIEIVSLLILYPTISIMLSKDKLNYSLYSESLKKISSYTQIDFFILTLLILILIYVLKSCYYIYVEFKKNSFLANSIGNISSRLFENYLQKEYLFFTKTESSTLVNNLQVEITQLFNYFQAIITILIDGILFLSIVLALLFIQPNLTILLITSISLVSFSISTLTKKKIQFSAKERQTKDENLTRIITDGFNLIKEIIVFDKSDFFIVKQRELNKSKAYSLSNYLSYSQIPRYSLEVIFIIILGLILIGTRLLPLDSIIQVLGLFIAGSFRAIPSLGRVLTSIQNIKFSSPSLEIFLKELLNRNNRVNYKRLSEFEKISFEEILIQDISYTYDNYNNILDNISLKIKKGTLTAIIGESGTGKTTLINILIGLLSPTKGKIILIDKNGSSKNLLSLYGKISYVPQSVHLINHTIKHNIAFGIKEDQIDNSKLSSAIELSGLKNFINSLEKKENTMVGDKGNNLSGGQIQRIGIARALYFDSEILVLDEVSSSLDSISESQINDTIFSLKNKKTVILITHRKDILKKCDSVFKLKKGKINQL